MRALVTGGTGFIGSNIALDLYGRGIDVVVTGNESEQKLPEGIKRLYPTVYGIDWSSLGKFDVLFHQAALNETTNLDCGEMMFANYDSSVRLFNYAIANGCKNIVYASSTAVYGDVPAPYKEDGPVNPLNPYAVSKLKLDEFVRDIADKYDTKIVGLRYCNVYGPGESHKGKRASMIYQLAQQMKSGKPNLFAPGTQKRDWIYVKDVVEANILASEAKESCIVNCGSGKATTFNDIVGFLDEVVDKIISYRYVTPGLVVSEVVNRDPFYISNPYGDRYQDYTECDMSLAKDKIGFVPRYGIRGGIRDFYDSGFLLK
ncbi:MAG: NAD-dependent epimerase/dehydratase family protein [archaeon]